MKKSTYPKAVKIHEENDFNFFMEECPITMKYDKKNGLIISFPDEVESYTYVAFGTKIIYICVQINGQNFRYGSM